MPITCRATIAGATHQRQRAPSECPPVTNWSSNWVPCWHLWPAEIDLADPQGRARIIAGLRRALRAQRRDARAGRWSYDIACHARLLELYRHLTLSRRRPPARSPPQR